MGITEGRFSSWVYVTWVGSGVAPSMVGVVPSMVGVVPGMVGVVPGMVGMAPGMVGVVPSIATELLQQFGLCYLGRVWDVHPSLAPAATATTSHKQ